MVISTRSMNPKVPAHRSILVMTIGILSFI
jgi:hypothetical protein